MVTTENSDARLEFEKKTRVETDVELEQTTSEDEDYESSPPNYEIYTYPADFTLEVLHQKWKSKDIKIPVFQRSFVWKQVQASKLIESFLVGLPVPAVFLYSERTSQKLLVIDGQQRLKSVFYFLDGNFSETKKFRLTGLNQDSSFSNKSYEELDDGNKLKLKNAVLRAFIVQQLNPNNDTSMYHIFERLNTGGTLLTNQEIRNSMYDGDFLSLLKNINTNEVWRKILGKKPPDNRKKDIELIVRFLSMRDISDYKKPMKDWLSKFMSDNRCASKGTLDEIRDLFEKTCEKVVESLGENRFISVRV